jgi:sulfur-oxidizing protein SoxY
MTPGRPYRTISRRRMLQRTGALALAAPIAALLPKAAAEELPAIPALATFLAGRTARWERLRLEVPPFADNGQAVPIRLTMSGPFTSPGTLQAIHLFSERNPVPEIAVFEFPKGPDKVEIDARIRLAGSQRIVAVAAMGDGNLYGAMAEIVVTIAGCLDES